MVCRADRARFGSSELYPGSLGMGTDGLDRRSSVICDDQIFAGVLAWCDIDLDTLNCLLWNSVMTIYRVTFHLSLLSRVYDSLRCLLSTGKITCLVSVVLRIWISLLFRVLDDQSLAHLSLVDNSLCSTKKGVLRLLITL